MDLRVEFQDLELCEFRSKMVSVTTGSPLKNKIFGGAPKIWRYTPINWELLITNLLELVQNSMSVFFNLASKTSTDLTGHKPKFTMAVQPPRRNSAFGAIISYRTKQPKINCDPDNNFTEEIRGYPCIPPYSRDDRQ